MKLEIDGHMVDFTNLEEPKKRLKKYKPCIILDHQNKPLVINTQYIWLKPPLARKALRRHLSKQLKTKDWDYLNSIIESLLEQEIIKIRGLKI